MREAYVKTYEISQYMLWGRGAKIISTEFSTWDEPYEKVAMRAAYESLKESHVFEVDARLGQVLVNTPNSMRGTIHLPFMQTFVDIILENDNRKYYGFLLLDLDALQDDGHEILMTPMNPKHQRIVVAACGVEDGKHFHTQYTLHPFDVRASDLESGEFTRRHKREKKMLFTAVANFIDFLNEPDVIVKRMKYDEKKAAKRVKLGKVPIPKIREMVRITGKLKKYLNSLKARRHAPYSHSFWVRGHWRTLMDDRYIHKQGQRVWVHPFVKGEGLLVDKTYDVKEDE